MYDLAYVTEDDLDEHLLRQLFCMSELCQGATRWIGRLGDKEPCWACGSTDITHRFQPMGTLP